ncbi:MAG: hypothetical protein JNN27_09355 [Planctomycetes bacterium]|nr:hypothetical protein [Planctomycetota bacterium]
MLALLLLVLQGVTAQRSEVPAPPPRQLPSGYLTHLVPSASGRVELAYSESSRTGDPVWLAVRIEQQLLWERPIDGPLELATVDERGWVAGFRWNPGPRPLRRSADDDVPGELTVYDSAGALKARRAVLLDRAISCLTFPTYAFDLCFVGESDLLLRASEFTNGVQAPRGECWSILNANDLSDVAHYAPAKALGRPNTPRFLPDEWGYGREPALDVRTLPGLAVLIVRWPFPNWRAVDGGVELQEDFTVLDLAGRKLAELSHSASERRAEPDPLFDLALPRYRTWRRDEWFRAGSDGRFALVRGLDGSWIDYRVVGDLDARRVERAP